MAEEVVGAAFVNIIPSFAEFDAILGAKITAAVASIEKQMVAAAGAASKAASAAAASVAGTAGSAGSAFAPLASSAKAATAAVAPLAPALAATEKAIVGVGSAAQSSAVSLGGFHKSFTGLARLGPIIVAALSIKAFTDFEKASKTAAVVFEDSAQSIISFSKNLDSSFGLSSRTALRFADDIGNALRGVGFSAKTAEQATEVLVKRTADVAAALSQSPEQINKAFMLAIEGNSRGLKQLGIAISGVDTQNKALALGYKGSFSALSDAQKANVFYQLVLERTAKFQGQAADTADTMAGRLRNLREKITDTGISIGRGLAPAVGGIVALFSGLFDVIAKIPGPLLAAATAAAVAAVAFQALSKSGVISFFSGIPAAIGRMVTAMGAAEGAAATMGVAFDALLGPVGLVALAAGALVGIFALTSHATVTLDDRLKALGNTAEITGNSFSRFLGKDLFAGLETIDQAIAKATELKGKVDEAAAGGVGGGSRAAFDLSTKLRENARAAKEQAGAAGDAVLENKALADTIALVKKAVDQGHIVDLRAAIAKANLADSVKNKLNKALDDEIEKVKQANKDNAASAAIFNDETDALGDYRSQVEATATAIQDLFKDQDALNSAVKRHEKTVTDLADAQKKLADVQKESADAEVVKGQEKLSEATDTLTGAIEREAIARKALDDLKAPATDRELAEVADRLAEANIGVARATRARDEALAKLNKTTGKSINLTGLSLDQLRTTLANARATLAAQRTVAAEDPAVLQENVTEAEINLRQAKNKVLDVQQEQFDLQNKLISNADKIIKGEHELEQAKRSVSRALFDQQEAQQELSRLQAGDTQHAKDLATARERVRDAVLAEQSASGEVSRAVAKQKDDTDAILDANKGITEEMRQQIIASGDLFTANASLRTALVDNVLAGLGVQIGPFSQSFIDKIFEALKGDPSKFKATLKSLGLAVPGAAHGAVITRPGLWQLGEWSRPEVVLPLTQPDRAWELIRQSLPHMALPLRKSFEDVVTRQRPTFDLGAVTPPVSADQPMTEATGARIANLLDELNQKLNGPPSGPVTVEVRPHAGMDENSLARKTAREVMRSLNG